MMTQQIDPIQIVNLPQAERDKALSEIFQSLMSLDENTVVKMMTGVLNVLASKATDEEYEKWCESGARVISTYDDNVIKAIIQLRAKAVSNLPKNLAERDAEIMNKVLQNLNYSIREKIMRNMK